MNWLGLIAALVVVFIVQTTLGHLADLPLLEVDLFLVLTLLYGILAASHDARLAGWLIGFAQDIGSTGPIGVHAFALGLTALLATLLRDVINIHVAWGRFLVAAGAALPGQVLILAHLNYVQNAQLGSWWNMLATALAVSLTASLVVTLLTLAPSLTPKRRVARRAPWGRR